MIIIIENNYYKKRGNRCKISITTGYLVNLYLECLYFALFKKQYTQISDNFNETYVHTNSKL